MLPVDHLLYEKQASPNRPSPRVCLGLPSLLFLYSNTTIFQITSRTRTSVAYYNDQATQTGTLDRCQEIFRICIKITLYPYTFITKLQNNSRWRKDLNQT